MIGLLSALLDDSALLRVDLAQQSA
jgi:hypothetical protein